MSDEMLVFDQAKVKLFKDAYAACKRAHRMSFTFEGNEFLVDYAKYMIEYFNLREGTGHVENKGVRMEGNAGSVCSQDQA